MSIVNRLLDVAAGESRAATLSEALAALRGSTVSHAGVSVSTEGALKLDAVWACVRLVSEIMSQLPWKGFREKPDGGREKLNPQPQLLRSPSANITRPEWVAQAVVSAMLYGNTIGLVAARDRFMVPTQIELQNPSESVIRARGGRILKYRIHGTEYDPVDVLHIRAFTLPGDVVGLNPISYARHSIGRGLASEEFSGSFFAEGGHPTAVLQTQKKFEPGEATEIKQRFLEAVRGAGVAALGAGMEYKPVQLSPADIHFLETEKWTVQKVARYFGVQPEWIGSAPDGSSITYANREQRLQDLLLTGINPWAARLETALSNLLVRGQYVKFNVDGFLRGDTKTRYEAHKIGVETGFRSINEIKRLEDEEPIGPEGDIYLWPPAAARSKTKESNDE